MFAVPVEQGLLVGNLESFLGIGETEVVRAIVRSKYKVNVVLAPLIIDGAVANDKRYQDKASIA